jgi:hypothetical protein
VKALLIGSLLIVVAVLTGCGDGRPALVEAVGTVTVNGKPVEGATVVLQPIEVEAKDFARPAAGVTDANGEFHLGAYGDGEGVPAGKYAVGIEKRELVGELPANYNAEMPEATPLKYRMIVPKQYNDPAQSGLTVEATSSGLEPATFDLKGPAEPVVETVGGMRRRANEP